MPDIIEFDYKEHRVRVRAELVNGEWDAAYGLTQWHDWHSFKAPATATREAVIAAGTAHAKYLIDCNEWKQDFIDKTNDLLMGMTDWEWEEPDQDWAQLEFDKRGGLSGDEAAQLAFDTLEESDKAKYQPGGDYYRTDLEKCFDRPSSGPVPPLRTGF